MDDRLIAMVKRHEGFVDHVYKCSAGKSTIGYGHNCEAHGDLEKYIGRTISVSEATELLKSDLEDVERDCMQIKDFETFTEVQRAVLIDMCFNLGIGGLMKFRKLLAALRLGDRRLAAQAMMDSLWYKQVGQRARRLIKMIEEDSWLSN